MLAVENENEQAAAVILVCSLAYDNNSLDPCEAYCHWHNRKFLGPHDLQCDLACITFSHGYPQFD